MNTKERKKLVGYAKWDFSFEILNRTQTNFKSNPFFLIGVIIEKKT